jgi:hypothetical protein
MRHKYFSTAPSRLVGRSVTVLEGKASSLSPAIRASSIGWLIFACTIVEVAVRGGSPGAVLFLCALTFWLTALPGTLIYCLSIGSTLADLRAWVFGTAIGMSLLALGSFVQLVLASQSAWWVVYAVISLWNVIVLRSILQKRRSQRIDANEHLTKRNSTRIAASPVSPVWYVAIGILWLAYLYYHLDFFYRTTSFYFFDDFFGGDISYLAAFVQQFQHSAILTDPHFGGSAVHYHDFYFRWLAGLSVFARIDIYDTVWFFGTTFTAVSFLGAGYYIANDFTGKRILSVLFVVLLLLYPGKSSAIFSENSDTYRLGLLQIFTIIYLYSSLLQKGHNVGRQIILTVLLCMLAKWKLPAAAALIPSLWIFELWKGRTASGHKARIVVLSISALIAFIYAAVLLHSSETGGVVVGRPLGLIVHMIGQVTGYTVPLTPVFAAASFHFRDIVSFIALLPALGVWTVIRSARSFALVMAPQNVKTPTPYFPDLRAFLLIFLVISSLLPLLASPRYFYTSEVYYREYGIALSGLYFCTILPQIWRQLRVAPRSVRGIVFSVSVCLILLVEIPLPLINHILLLLNPRRSVPTALIHSLGRAKEFIPEDARVASHRFDLDPIAERTRNPALPNEPHHVWNFEFYATSLERTMLLEGPSNGILGGMATNSVEPQILLTVNPVSVEWLRSTLRDLDTLYYSRSAEAVRVARSHARATHLLIDHTIGQRVGSGTLSQADTIYDDQNITILRFR